MNIGTIQLMPQYAELSRSVVALRAKAEADSDTQFSIIDSSA